MESLAWASTSAKSKFPYLFIPRPTSGAAGGLSPSASSLANPASHAPLGLPSFPTYGRITPPRLAALRAAACPRPTAEFEPCGLGALAARHACASLAISRRPGTLSVPGP